MSLNPPRDLIAQALGIFKPRPRLNLPEWADAHYYLSADAGAADPGRWRTLPFQREWMIAMTDPRVREAIVMKSARVGYTETIKALIGYHVHHDPCPIMVIQPNDGDAKGFAKESIDPMIRDCPAVGAQFNDGPDETMLLRRFTGGVLDIVGARSPGNFRRKGRRLIVGDEVDGYPASAGKEGDPIKLAKKRSEYFWNRKWVWGSTPTDAGTSKIEALFLTGDQRRYYVPCPHCDEGQVLQFQNLKWPAGQPELAAFVCIHCGCEIGHEHKLAMLEHGEWRPGPHPQFPDVPPPPEDCDGVASFHIWTAYSVSPNASWGDLAKEFVEATHSGDIEKLKTFVNTTLGETWKDKGDAPDWRRLYDRRETYARNTCPPGVLLLTAAVDVQHKSLIYEVVGWGRGKESWSIDAGVIPGDPSDVTATGPWRQVDALLDHTFRHEGGAELRIRMLAIDTGDQTQTVYGYVRDASPGRVMAVKGNDSETTLVGTTPKKVDVTVSGKRVGSIVLWRVGGPIAKSELYGWLKLQQPTDEQRALGAVPPHGYCHFPEYGEEYFKQLTGEHLVSHKTAKGFTVREWQMIPGRENHFLDCRVYARAAAAVIGVDRWRDSHWTALERELGRLEERVQAAAPVPVAADAPGAAPSAPTVTPRPAPAPRAPRIGRSRYLGRG